MCCLIIASMTRNIATRTITYNRMGRLQRLVDMVILSFLLKSVNGQAIFDEETAREERFLNLASQVMDTKLGQLTQIIEEQLTQKLDAILDLITDVQGTDCADILKKFPLTSGRDGVYNIRLTCNKLKQVHCDMKTDNGGWTVIQRRIDGSVDFYRNWTEYQNGFGNARCEYWIGNEILHKLTSARNYELRVDMQRFNGEKAYALYSNFSVGDENSKYQLTVQGYSGNAGDGLTYSNKMKFSTMDQDNDKDLGSCSTHLRSAGWFNSCSRANPNGQYTDYETKSMKFVNWYEWKKYRFALKNIQLMIRPKA